MYVCCVYVCGVSMTRLCVCWHFGRIKEPRKSQVEIMDTRWLVYPWDLVTAETSPNWNARTISERIAMCIIACIIELYAHRGTKNYIELLSVCFVKT